MSEIIPTPYDEVIVNAEKFMEKYGFNQLDKKQLDRAEGQRAAYREGVQAEREQRGLEEAGPSRKPIWTPPVVHRPGPESNSPPFPAEQIRAAVLGFGPTKPESEGHPGQWAHFPVVTCEIHPDGCHAWTPGKAEGESPKPEVERSEAYMVTGKAELRMVRVDAPGFKGEHTGRAKLECPQALAHRGCECGVAKALEADYAAGRYTGYPRSAIARRSQEIIDDATSMPDLLWGPSEAGAGPPV